MPEEKEVIGPPSISVIIPAHNEEEYLENTLKALKEQTHSSFEIIVIADGCTDATFDLAKNYTPSVFAVDYHNVAQARNFGAMKAKAGVFAFIDADTIVAPNYLTEIHNALLKGTDYGAAKIRPESKNILARVFALCCNVGEPLFKTVGGNCFVTREGFDLVQGFSPELSLGEDTHFGRELHRRKKQYKFLRTTYIVPSERKFRARGYARYFFTCCTTVFWAFTKQVVR